MRMKRVKAVSAAARWIQRVLEVRLPMDKLYGLRTQQEFSDVYKNK